MRPPLDNWDSLPRGYRFGVLTHYNAFHLGLDLITDVGTPIYAPEAGNVVNVSVGPQGGLTLHYRLKNGPLVRFLHLSRIIQEGGEASEGEILARTGGHPDDQPHAGWSSGPHVHIDIWHSGRIHWEDGFTSDLIDPDLFFMNQSMTLDQLVNSIFKQPAVNDNVRAILVTEGKDAGKVGLLYKDGTIRVAQNDKGKFQALYATVAKGVSSAEWAKFREGAPLE
jgi:hypothetical protein